MKFILSIVAFVLLILILNFLIPIIYRDVEFTKSQKTIVEQIDVIMNEEVDIEILSLDPKVCGRHPNDNDYFHDYKILGRIKVEGLEDQKSLISALKKSILENKGMVAKCFNPRHGIRFTKGTRKIDLVICFECFSAQCFGMNNDIGFLLTGSAAPSFNAFLTKMNIPLANE